MSPHLLQRLWPAVLIVAATSLQAAPAPAPVPATHRPDPTDPAAATPPLNYRSPFPGGRQTPSALPTDWLQANRDVATIGGWRAYAREAQAPEPAASAVTDAPRAHPPTPHNHAKPHAEARP